MAPSSRPYTRPLLDARAIADYFGSLSTFPPILEVSRETVKLWMEASDKPQTSGVGVSKDDPVCVSSEESSDMDESQDGLVNTTPGESSANNFDFEPFPIEEGKRPLYGSDWSIRTYAAMVSEALKTQAPPL